MAYETHTITEATKVEDTVMWLTTKGQSVAVIETPFSGFPPPHGRYVGLTAVVFRAADAPNESLRMAVVGEVLVYREGQIHIDRPKDLRS